MENLAKARAKQAAQRTGLDAPESATGSKPSAGTRHQSPEWMKVEGGQSPVIGQRYVNRNGVHVERAAPGELLYRYDGREFPVRADCRRFIRRSQILNQDAQGRVLISRERRALLLEDYDRSGVSGIKFAQYGGNQILHSGLLAIAARSVGIARMQATASYPKYSMTSRLNFSGFSMNIKCWPPSDSSNTSNCEPLI